MMTKKNCFPKTTGTLKKSIPNNALEFMLRLHAYKNAIQYKEEDEDMEFKLILEVDVEAKDEFEAYQRIVKALHNNGFNFRRGTIIEKEKQHTYMHGTGM